MKLLSTFVVLLAAVARFAPPASAESTENPSAYTALRVVQKEVGAESLGRVVEITGREGVPQPFVWKVLLNEKTGPGLREVEVAGGRLAGSRALSRSARPGFAGTPINLRDLNLDSSGAFTTADAQARRVRASFDALTYTLRIDPATGKPVWSVTLQDADRREVGALSIAASDGTVLASTGRIAADAPIGPAPTTTPAGTTTTTTTITSAEEAEERAEGGFFERSGRTLDKTGKRVERTLRRTGESIGSKFDRFFKRGEGSD